MIHIFNVTPVKTYRNFKMCIFWSNSVVTMVTMATNEQTIFNHEQTIFISKEEVATTYLIWSLNDIFSVFS